MFTRANKGMAEEVFMTGRSAMGTSRRRRHHSTIPTYNTSKYCTDECSDRRWQRLQSKRFETQEKYRCRMTQRKPKIGQRSPNMPPWQAEATTKKIPREKTLCKEFPVTDVVPRARIVGMAQIASQKHTSEWYPGSCSQATAGTGPNNSR
jgi:hypothetical protein